MNIFTNFTSENERSHLHLLSFLLLVSSLMISMVESQPTYTFSPNAYDNQYPYSKFNPSVLIIIVVLVAALFFLGFLSIYIRQCAEANNPSDNNIRNALAIARRAAAAAATRGLEASVIETFPTFSYAEVKDHKIGKGALECAVCLNEFEEDETLRFIPKCDHVFHAECIDAWLENHVTCPVCRANLNPQPGDEPYSPPESNRENSENNDGGGRNDDVAVQVEVPEEQVEVKPEVNRIWSFKHSNRPARAESVKRVGRSMIGLGKFRSHSTGHSLVQPGENLDRFTLRLPQEIRKGMMNRALLNRTKSVAACLPREGSTQRGYKTGFGDGSSRGGSGSTIQRIEQPNRSDRWLFSKAPPFFSVKSTKVAAENGGPSISTIAKLPSLKCSEPKNIDERYLMSAEPDQPPV